jgi:F0F1-type ATP synthase assembly protein I
MGRRAIDISGIINIYPLSIALLQTIGAHPFGLLYWLGYMKRQAADTETTPDRDDTRQTDGRSPLRQLRVMQALLATTWRIAVPVTLGTGLGIFLDLRIGSKPWLTLVGVVLGFVLAGFMIARLLKETEES